MERFETPHLRINLFQNGTAIQDIAVERIKDKTEPTREDTDDPFIIFDLGDLVAKDNQWRKLLPNVETFFAVKCNPDPVVLRLMSGLGRGFDCASKKEIQMVLDLGVSPSRIIFAHPCKQESHLRFAKEKGVRLMTFDTEKELYKVKRFHPDAQLVLRIFASDSTATFKVSQKFGCHEKDVRPLMELGKELGLDIVGVCFHIGAEGKNPDVYRETIQRVRPMFDIGRSIGFNMKILDIGGGFPGRKHPTLTFNQYAVSVRNALAEYFPPSSGVRVIAEPGTFYTRSAGYLVANIIAKRVYEVDVNEEKAYEKGLAEPCILMYYLNVGVCNGLIHVLFDSQYFELPEPLGLKKTDDIHQLKPSCIWGPTCDSNDVIFKRCRMPEMEAGSFVLFHDMGGYVRSRAGDFNGYGPPPTCFVAPQEIRSLLERIFSPEVNV